MTKQNKTILATGIGIAGNVAGIVLAVHRKSGFWGGLGWFIVGGLTGTAIGYAVYAALPETPDLSAAVAPPAAKPATAIAPGAAAPVGSYI
jgi:hypothetical protein